MAVDYSPPGSLAVCLHLVRTFSFAVHFPCDSLGPLCCYPLLLFRISIMLCQVCFWVEDVSPAER